MYASSITCGPVSSRASSAITAGATSAQVAADQANLQSAQDGLTSSQQALAGASLVATFDGTVSQVNVTVGEQLGSSGNGGTALTGSGTGSGQSLAAGNYYVVISLRTDNAPYLIRMTADYAGNSLRTARNIGSVTDATFPDFLGNGPQLVG